MPTEKNVVIYSTPTCHFCQLSKDFFKENGVTYREFNVASDMEKRQEMVEKSGGMAVPVIDIDGEIIVGFDKEKLEKALELA
jgi:glutaredoxin-like YruB-family protein